MGYSSDGAWEVVKVEGNKVTVSPVGVGHFGDEGVREIVIPSPMPPGWPELRLGLQLLCRSSKSGRLQWRPAKRQPTRHRSA